MGKKTVSNELGKNKLIKCTKLKKIQRNGSIFDFQKRI